MEEIKEQITNILKHSQELSTVHIDDLWDNWTKKVEKLNAFLPFSENNYIIESKKEIEMPIDEAELRTMLQKFIKQLDLCNSNLSLFVSKIELNEFFANMLNKPFVLKDGDKEITIPKGTTVVKAFKYFEEDQEALEILQNKASMLIQKKKLRGKLCISIHPLDYLSSSENTYNWRSCHSLDGAYRAGNLSYIGDICTIVCYLKTKDRIKLPHFPDDILWNSKKWRMLLHVSDTYDMLIAGRQYPFNCGVSILKEVIKLIKDNSNYNYWTNWDNSCLTEYTDGNNNTYYTDRYIMGKPFELMRFHDIIEESDNPLHYNDILHSSVYDRPYYCYRSSLYSEGRSCYRGGKFYMGSDVYCINCDHQHIYADNNSMLCEDCFEELFEHVMECEGCGRMVNKEELVNFRDILICEDCFNNYTAVCGLCGERYWTSDGEHNIINEHFYCYGCLNKEEEI